jgi:radical SAM-linked protein
MAFSAGFHPHPKISYTNAATTGTASEAEYVELQVTERVDPAALQTALDEALPPGLDVMRVVEARGGSLADRLEASDWRLEFDLPDELLRAAVDQLLALDEALVTRMMKSGPRTFDVRSAIVSAEVTNEAGPRAHDMPRGASGHEGTGGCAILRLVVRHSTPAVRPDDILTALRERTGLQPPRPPLVTRLAQGPLDTATARVADPLAADENADGI